MKNNLKKISLIVFIFSTFLFTYNSIVSVKAENNENLKGQEKWNIEVTSPATGKLTSSSEKSFIADLDSIGTEYNEITVKLEGLSLKKGETYIYSSDMLSDKKRGNLYFRIYDKTTNDVLYGDFIINLDKNIKTTFTKSITVDKNYNDVVIEYGLGYNGYEASITTRNDSNKITVDNISFTNINDYNYKTLTYKKIDDSISGTYKNFYYNNFLDTDIPHPDSKNGKDSIAYPSHTGNIAKTTDGKYKVYLNNKLIEPLSVDIEYWVHLDYETLIYEYNVISAVSVTGGKSVIVIKNENVTNYKNEKLEELSSYENSTNTSSVNKIIDKYKEKLKDATTKQEADTIVNEFKKELDLQKEKDVVIDRMEKLITGSTSENVKKIINDYIDKVSKETEKDKIQNLESNLLSDISLQEEKDNAILQLENKIGTNYSDKIKSIYEKAKTDINNATTKEKITSILEKAISDIENTLQQEQQNNSINNNPLTYDNIKFYIILLVIGSTGMVYFLRKYKKEI